MSSKNKNKETLDFYLGLEYPITVHTDPEGGFVAEIEDLPGCMTQAETLDDLFEAVQNAKHGWIEAAHDMGQDIPLPKEVDDYKGRILLRVPRSLHRNLVSAAKREGVSLNQYITSLLAAGVQGDFLAAGVSPLYAHQPGSVWLISGQSYPVYLDPLSNIFGTKEEPKQFAEVAMLQSEKVGP